MWIRSQNRKTIVYVLFVEICNFACSDGSECSECEIITRKEGQYITLGKYSNTEKALKVLDKIEPILNGDEWADVFQMPSEQDV